MRIVFNYTNYFYKRIRVLRGVDVYFFKQKISAVKTKKTAGLAERFIEIIAQSNIVQIFNGQILVPLDNGNGHFNGQMIGSNA
ncbi:hypothetical protein KKH38_00690, partial [Patescibacteria group bacterium]|nr:hypothetical protein [Patescibacteria group bacterium]MBU4600977.1 hypothetical protein [Patescibacteria group bacterium]MCG2697611.1 hypothetical protein [Candidatus Parcubacteria bacterium]